MRFLSGFYGLSFLVTCHIVGTFIVDSRNQEEMAMAGYISFSVPDSGTVLVEVEESEIAGQTGSPIKAGLVDKVKDTVAIAGSTLEEALRRVIGYNVDALYSAVHGVPHPPTEVEMTFALKATGELSNLAVGKLSGEANYTVKLVWKGAQGA